MAKSNHYEIAVIPGDGTGPEVIAEGKKVLEAAGKKHGISFEFHDYDFGGDRYLKTGETLPDSAAEELKRFKAIYLGDMYAGQGGVTRKGTPYEVATQVMVYDRQMVDRCLKYAFDLARVRKEEGKPGKFTLVNKTNVLVYVGDLWYRAFMEMAKGYPEIRTDYNHIDAACMWTVKNPEWYDVMVTTNMFGDIIPDLGAMVQGGMGIAAGANTNPYGTSMFETIGGSAPKYTGMNIINPLAAIEAGRMMLDHLGGKEAAKSIEEAVAYTCTKLKSLSAGKMGYSTTEVGDMVAGYINKK